MSARASGPTLSRRGLLGAAAGAAVLAGTGWTLAGAVPLGDPAATIPAPPDFPADIPLSQQQFVNWAKTIRFDAVWTATARTADDVVRLANWAHAHGFRIRPRGSMHSWSPLTLEAGQDIENVVLVDTMSQLNQVVVDADAAPPRVTAGGGASIESILTTLEANGLGWANSPAIGDISIAGALSIGAHGATYPAAGETVIPGQSFGSLSNLVLALTAVVWNPSAGAYELREFRRAEPEIRPLLAHLGRTFVTSVTLQAGANYRVRCQSFTDIPWRELFAPPGSPGRTFERYVEEHGRVEAIWFPFTETPWLKIWSVSPEKPAASREVQDPYNYYFSDSLPEELTDLLGQVVRGAQGVTPTFGASQFGAVAAGLAATGTKDLWGWSKDLLFYLRAATLRVVAGGGVVVTRRDNIARVINEFTTWLHERMTHYASLGQYPVNMPFEVRLCKVDDADEVLVDAAGVPDLSPVRPRPDRPDWDSAIWMNVVSIPGTAGMPAFFREMEQWMAAHYSGDYATFRSEWSKGWAFDDEGGYRDPGFLGETVPAMYRTGLPSGQGWDAALAAFEQYDPHRVFSNRFLDRLLP
ncbi:cholesterol oxidase substrate-binding domain-containing protein [Rhodococcus sp. GA1]|uniref:cholesterol oxidase substrate-binding domain-containing protein n=1 Tax=Rhodococcus sp. GA1 TaxID=2942275 RepID=UPI0020CE442F|nr:cholesterol oxidase substrate-binding domain-containing protein [Rhodococcus sp. GA1]